jgi:hypothetical protein
VFDLLRDHYALAIERLGTPRGDRRVLADPDERLAEHLMAFHWGKKLDLRDPLLERFWKKASDEVRADAIEFIGRSLKNTEGKIEPKILMATNPKLPLSAGGLSQRNLTTIGPWSNFSRLCGAQARLIPTIGL